MLSQLRHGYETTLWPSRQMVYDLNTYVYTIFVVLQDPTYISLGG